ncbi:hypothetical protein [Microcoleus sp. T3_A4]|uniref:hypothetical protein n=1 Tax=Microcoleus sp. T3_A4 TaxID=2818968 RepID=UPI002FD68D72
MNRLFGLFHKKIYILWNRPKSLLLTMVQEDIRCNGCQEEGKGKREEGRSKKEEGKLSPLPT